MDGSNSKVLHQNQRDPVGQYESFGQHTQLDLLFCCTSNVTEPRRLFYICFTCLKLHLFSGLQAFYKNRLKHLHDLQKLSLYNNPSALDLCSSPLQITQYHKTRQKIEGICQFCLVMDSNYDNFIKIHFPASTAVQLHAPLCIHVHFIPNSFEVIPLFGP